MDVRARTLRPCATQINRKFVLISSRSGYHTKRPEMLNSRGFQAVCRGHVSAPLQRIECRAQSIHITAVTSFLDQFLHRLIAEQFAQHRIDATRHALQTAADIDGGPFGQP